MYALDQHRYSLGQYTGPIGLLLHLVRQQELDIRSIPVSALAEQFRAREDASMDEGAEFLVGASALLWLKSCALVPTKASPTALPEADFEELLHIADYCRLKHAAEDLSTREENAERHFPRGLSEPIAQPDPEELSVDELAQMLNQLLKRKPKRITIEDEEYRVEDCLLSLTEQLKAGPLRFDVLFALSQPRGHLIVTFLAILELMKRQELRILRHHQEVLFVGRDQSV